MSATALYERMIADSHAILERTAYGLVKRNIRFQHRSRVAIPWHYCGIQCCSRAVLDDLWLL
jgi:hypothetical protein